CQERMLEHLYDLLEGDEQRDFLNHLAGCAACQATLAKARDQQRLLANAARASFPEVRFTPPVETVTTVPAEVVLPLEAPAKKRSARWAWWAAAAAVLIALAGLAVPGERIRRDRAEARDTVREHEEVIAAAAEKANDASRDVQLALLERDERVNALEQQ